MNQFNCCVDNEIQLPFHGKPVHTIFVILITELPQVVKTQCWIGALPSQLV